MITVMFGLGIPFTRVALFLESFSSDLYIQYYTLGYTQGYQTLQKAAVFGAVPFEGGKSVTHRLFGNSFGYFATVGLPSCEK